MGNTEVKTPQWRPKPIDKIRYEITITKVSMYLQLYRDRRQGEVKAKENALCDLVSRPKRSRDDEGSKAQSIVADLNWIKAANIVLRFCDVLKDRTFEVISNQGDASKIPDLLPYIDSVIWASRRLNLQQVAEFVNLINDCFGPEVLANIERSTRIDAELRECFKNTIPTPWEVNDYWNKFAEKYNFSIDELNKAGHGINQLPPNPNSFGGAGAGFGGGAPFGGQPFGAPGAGGPGFGGGFGGFPGGPGGGIPQQPPQGYNPNPFADQPFHNPMQGQNVFGAGGPGMGGGVPTPQMPPQPTPFTQSIPHGSQQTAPSNPNGLSDFGLQKYDLSSPGNQPTQTPGGMGVPSPTYPGATPPQSQSGAWAPPGPAPMNGPGPMGGPGPMSGPGPMGGPAPMGGQQPFGQPPFGAPGGAGGPGYIPANTELDARVQRMKQGGFF